MTVSTKEFVVIPTSILQVAAEGISTVIKSPEENPTATPTEEQLKYYVDTIELTGINAFGFKKQNMQKNGATENRYFRTGCDLEKIKVKQIEYAYKGVSLKTETYNNTLASSERYYKYNSSAVIGRYVDITKYEIPTLPGWVYENKDYAYVTLNITLGDDTGERYVLPIEIKVSKYSENIISQKAAATNVSDDVAFNVATHINAEAALNYTYYDDSIAITLPGNGKVSVRVEAKYDHTTIASPENKYYLANGTAVGNGAGYDNNDLYVKLDGKFYKAYYSGVKTLYSNYATMDSIQMLGLSQTVGHTLNTNYDVKVSFFDYDNERVTRDGNFGFYATYGVDNLVQDGNGGQLTDDKTLLDAWSAGDYSYAFGYGQMEENGNLGEFTLIADGTTNGANRNYIVVPTESIVRGDTDKLPIGTKFVSRANYANKVGEVKNITINNGVNAGGETEKWQQYNNTASNFDKINVPDAGNLVDGKLLITRYYLARCGAGDANGQTYQFMKDYKVYPRYFDLSTTDPINNRIESTAGAVETVDGIAYHTFNLSGWGGDVILTYYGTIGSSSTVRLNAVDISPFYFELGEKGTTSAKIDPDTGKLYAKTSEYKLNGDEYISINIYVKASGENRKYVDDNLPFSGNDNNKPKITVKIYLNSGLTMFERLTKIETDYASSWSNADVPTDRDEILGYFRSAESSYTSAEWTAFAGKTDKIVAEFVPLVATDAFLSSLRGMGTYSPSVDWSIDFTHFFAALDMYNNTSNKTYNMVTLTPQQIADLGGWGGDLASVIVNQIKGGVSDEETALANALSLIKATSGSSFGLLDYCANIDASNLWHTKLKSNATIKIGTAMQEYYDSKTTTKLKVESYLLNEFAYTYGTKADELAEIEYLAGLIQSRIAGNNGIKGYIAGQCGITNPLEILGIHSTYAAQISGVCEAYAIKLINDLK